MASIKDRALAAFHRLRERRPFVDHLVRMQGHYGEVNAGQQAGGVTYFGFLSFFPILALAVFVVGVVSRVYAGADRALVDVLNSVLPGVIGEGDGKISLASVQDFSGIAGVIGLLGVIYAGLGWLSALREALITVFEQDKDDQLNFVFGKLRDLLTLAVIGGVLLGSVAITGLVGAGSSFVLDLLGLGEQLEWLVKIVSVVLGVAANTVLFFAMFQLLGRPHAPRRAVWRGALLGAVGFEVLKQASAYLLAATASQPAGQAFGIALILVVWINYFSRVVLYAAAFTHTAVGAREQRAEEADENDAAVSTPASVTASAAAAGGAAGSVPGPTRSTRQGSWRDGFVDRIDAADAGEVGEASAGASQRAREQHRDDVRKRLAVAGAAAGAVGLVMAAFRRSGDQ